MGRRRQEHSAEPCHQGESPCSDSTLVYRSAAAAYRNLSSTDVTVQQISQLLEAPGGYLQQYECTTKTTGCTKENATVFANVITAAVDALAEIGVFPGTGPSGPTGPVITALTTSPPLPTPPGMGLTIPVNIYDPAIAAFFIINILLAQYEIYVATAPHGAPLCEVGQIFAQAFRDIFTSLLTTLPSSHQVVDLTYISAVGHYVDLQLGFTPAIPIISYTP